MRITAIILGAGSGSRMNISKSKLLLNINGESVLKRCVRQFKEIQRIDKIIVVCREDDLPEFENQLFEYRCVDFVNGGETRQQSVFNAISNVDADTDFIAIHDGARPLVTAKIINDTIDEAINHGASATGVPVKDTIKTLDDDGFVINTPNRASLFSIQTPQIFKFDLYKRAISHAICDNVDLTDDCQLIERLGEKVKTVVGDYGNIKITTAEDVPLAISILKQRGEIS